MAATSPEISEDRPPARTYSWSQRIALWATSQGLALQPLNQLVERQDREQTGAAAARFSTVLDDLLGAPLRAQMMFRIGRPTTQALRSPRRPLAWSMST